MKSKIRAKCLLIWLSAFVCAEKNEIKLHTNSQLTMDILNFLTRSLNISQAVLDHFLG